MISDYLKTSWPGLWNHRLIGMINIGGLAITMAHAMLIFLRVQNEFSFNNYHTKKRLNKSRSPKKNPYPYIYLVLP